MAQGNGQAGTQIEITNEMLTRVAGVLIDSGFLKPQREDVGSCRVLAEECLQTALYGIEPSE